MHLKLTRDEDGRPAYVLHVHGYVLREDSKMLEKAIWAGLGEECQAMEEAGVDRIQWDVMDGQFVPNLTLGLDIIAAVRDWVALRFEAHLMTLQPKAWCDRMASAGCELIIVHAEACTHLHRALTAIRAAGARSGVALNPATPPDAVAHVLDLMNLLLLMTVNPGFGGQQYIAAMESRITAARRLIDETGAAIELEVDGESGRLPPKDRGIRREPGGTVSRVPPNWR